MSAESRHTSLTRMEAFSMPSFTGKERDEETGYGYFGARYMDHELMTIWLSVDPMADKYPNVSPYAYCAWNPLKLVDPEGRDWFYNEKLRLYDFLPIIYDELGIPYYRNPNVGYNFDPPPDYKEIEL